MRLVELTEPTQHHQAADLLARVWKAAAVLESSTMTAVAMSGGYVAGAYEADRLVGASCALIGLDDHGLHLHSHVTGIEPGLQRHGLGYELKQHQRAWCARRGIPEIRWTYDPLVARNAYFNLHRLGARVVAYLPDAYGPLPDGINAGDTTDRLYVHWDVADPVPAPAVDVAALRAEGAAVVVDRVEDEPRRVGELADSATLLVAAPSDVEALRERDPRLAARWRAELAEVLPAALAAGYEVVGCSRDAYYCLKIPQ